MTREIVLLYHLANIPLSCHDEKTTELTQRSHNVVGPQFNWEPSRYQRKCLGTRHIIYPTAVLIEVLFIGSQFSNLYPVLDLIQNRRLRLSRPGAGAGAVGTPAAPSAHTADRRRRRREAPTAGTAAEPQRLPLPPQRLPLPQRGGAGRRSGRRRRRWRRRPGVRGRGGAGQGT